MGWDSQPGGRRRCRAAGSASSCVRAASSKCRWVSRQGWWVEWAARGQVLPATNYAEDVCDDAGGLIYPLLPPLLYPPLPPSRPPCCTLDQGRRPLRMRSGGRPAAGSGAGPGPGAARLPPLMMMRQPRPPPLQEKVARTPQVGSPLTECRVCVRGRWPEGTATLGVGASCCGEG